MPPKKNAEEATPPPVADATENAPDPKLLEQKAMVERELVASHLAAQLARVPNGRRVAGGCARDFNG